MSYLHTFETLLESIQETGSIYGKAAYVFKILGRRAGFTSITVSNDVKEFDNAVADMPELSNSTLDIISSSASDTSAGTGVQQVKVTYINNSNNLVESAAISLNGTTLVTSVLTGVNQVVWMQAVAVGSGGVAAGNIRLRVNGGTVEVEQISAGLARSLTARFMVPAGYTGYVQEWRASAVNNDQDVRIRATTNLLDRSISTVYITQLGAYTPINSSSGSLPGAFLKFPALTRIKCSTVSAATGATVRCDAQFTVVIVQN